MLALGRSRGGHLIKAYFGTGDRRVFKIRTELYHQNETKQVLGKDIRCSTPS